jgi:hypothetical protein
MYRCEAMLSTMINHDTVQRLLVLSKLRSCDILRENCLEFINAWRREKEMALTVYPSLATTTLAQPKHNGSNGTAEPFMDLRSTHHLLLASSVSPQQNNGDFQSGILDDDEEVKTDQPSRSRDYYSLLEYAEEDADGGDCPQKTAAIPIAPKHSPSAFRLISQKKMAADGSPKVGSTRSAGENTLKKKNQFLGSLKKANSDSAAISNATNQKKNREQKQNNNDGVEISPQLAAPHKLECETM